MSGRRTSVLAAALLALAGLLLLAVPSTQGALTGRVTNTDTAASNIYARCTTAATATGSALFVHPLDDPVGTAAVDVTGNGRTGRFYGGVTLNQAGPCTGASGRSVLLDGSSGFVHNPSRQTNPQVFSTQVWFRTTAGYGAGGQLIGFGNGDGTTQSGSYDRHVYMTNNGRLVFGVFPGLYRTLTTTASYNDGAWHQVVTTLAPITAANPGMRLYVDGALVASDPLTGAAQGYDGYWRMGWNNLATWPDVPSSQYFRGNLAYGAVFTATLTAAQVSALYAART